MTQPPPNLRMLLRQMNGCSPGLVQMIAKSDQLKLQLKEMAVTQRIRLGIRSGHITALASDDGSQVTVHWSDGSESVEALTRLSISA